MIHLNHRRQRRLFSNRRTVFGAFIVSALFLFVVVGPWLSSHDPYASDFEHGIDANGLPIGPSSVHLLGVDRIYRDELVRLAYGGRISLAIGVSATLIASIIGSVVGVIAGYTERENRVITLDDVLMRIVDVLLSFPYLLLVMAIGAALEKTSILTILLTFGATGWLGIARVVRAKTLQVRHTEFVIAARALGQRTSSILFKHILPSVLGPVIVLSTTSVAQMIIAESVLGYLGVGLSPPTPSWGHMIFEGQDAYLSGPWLLAAPAFAIVLTVFGFNLLGEGLRDALDPKNLS